MGRTKLLQEAKAVWVKVNDQQPLRYLLVPISLKLDLGGQQLKFGDTRINDICSAFTAKGLSLLPFDSLKKLFPVECDGSSATRPVLIVGPSALDSHSPAQAPEAPEANETDQPLRRYGPAVKRLMMYNRAGSTETAGTVVFISAEGHFLTSLHCLLLKGLIFINTFTVDGHKIKHVVSFPGLDIFVGKILDPASTEREFLSISVTAAVGTSYYLVHYPLVVDQEAQQAQPDIPTITQGVLAAAANGTLWIGDAESFPNSSGGAACADGQLMAVHTCSLTHEDIPSSQDDEDEDLSALAHDVAWVGSNHNRIQEGDEPADDSVGERSSQTLTPRTVTRKLLRAEANGSHKGTLCGMVPGSILQPLLAKYGVIKLPKVINLHAAMASRKRKKT